jgi:hypothetical protein
MRRVLTTLGVAALICSVSVVPTVAANVAILMPGSSGIVPGDFLVRNQARIEAAGIRTILTTSPSAAAEAIAAEAAQGRKAVPVGQRHGRAPAVR